MPWDEPDLEEDLTDEPSRRQPFADALTAALDAPGFASDIVIDECAERFPLGHGERFVTRDPERFDRFYWEPVALLIDIVEAGSPEEVERQRERKRVEFKARWCAEHGRAYLVLTDVEAGDGELVRARVRAIAEQPADAPQRPRTLARKPAAKRGQVLRPQAA